jgi:hypothetical protein
MSTAPPFGPEERWRRTVDQRGRPLKLKVGRLLKEFGYVALEPGVGDAIEASLGQVGLHVRPSLRDVTADQVITLELVNPSAPVSVPASSTAAPAPAAAETIVAEDAGYGVVADRPFHRTAEPFERAPEPAGVPPAPVPRRPAEPAVSAAGDELDQSLLVRAAVEAERRVRSAYDRSAAAAAERIAGLEREISAEREATAQARDERDELERRMHLERREAAARIQALAAAERTARGLLEAQRTELSNLTQTVRVSSAAIAQTRDSLGDVHEQVQQTANDVRTALTDDLLLDELAQSAPPEIAPPDDGGGDYRAAEAAEAAGVEHEPAGEAAQPAEPADEQLDELEPHPGDGGGPQHAHGESPAMPAWAQESERLPARKGRRAERLRRRASIVCAVCGRQGKTRDPAELIKAGWRVEGDSALCVPCMADDWQLAEGDSVPFRAHG